MSKEKMHFRKMIDMNRGKYFCIMNDPRSQTFYYFMQQLSWRFGELTGKALKEHESLKRLVNELDERAVALDVEWASVFSKLQLLADSLDKLTPSGKWRKISTSKWHQKLRV